LLISISPAGTYDTTYAFFRLRGDYEKNYYHPMVAAKHQVSIFAITLPDIKFFKPVRVIQSLCRRRETDTVLDEIGFRVFSVRLESGGIPKELSMRESDGIDSLWGEPCRNRTRWTCVNE
jgi:hypothetical protein